MRRDRPNLIRVGVYAGLLVAVEILYMIEGVSVAPAGMIAAAALVAGCPWSRTIWAVAAALAVAVAADLIPPADYLPFLNRRAFAVGGVLAAGWWLLRRREEGRAVALLGILLGAAELASLVDRGGGLSPWGHLVLDMRAAGDLAPLLNSRFLFLLGAAGAAFVGARRWRHLAIAGHVYLAAALGAEAVGLVEPGLRADPWSAFVSAGNHMAEHLALTGVILVYGAGLVTAGILRGRPLARRVGLGMLVFGAAKVSLFDLTALGDLYRVGSFVVLGSTFLMGSYAYHRWVSTEKRFENDTDPAEVSPQGYE